MSVAKITELSSSSTKSFEDAINKAIARADKTLDNIRGAWVETMKVDVKNGKVSGYRVNLKVTFELKNPTARKTKKKAKRKTKRK